MPNTGTLTGLTGGTEYILDAVHVDGWGNVSGVISSTPFTTAAASGVSIAYQDSATFENGGTGLGTHTFSGLNIGAATSDRVVVVAAYHALDTLHSAPPSSVTIGGVNATLGGYAGTPGDTCMVSIWSAPVPSGTTVDVTLTSPSSFRCCGVGVYSGDRLAVARVVTNTATAASALSLDAALAEGDGVVAIAGASGVASWTWTGLTENYDIDARSDETLTGASASGSAAATPHTITAHPATAGDLAGVALIFEVTP
jgi:hypothetical protein